MAVLDKWQQREARQYAADNGVSYEDAVGELFPDEPVKVPADEQSADEQSVDEQDEPKPPATSSRAKASK